MSYLGDKVSILHILVKGHLQSCTHFEGLLLVMSKFAINEFSAFLDLVKRCNNWAHKIFFCKYPLIEACLPVFPSTECLPFLFLHCHVPFQRLDHSSLTLGCSFQLEVAQLKCQFVVDKLLLSPSFLLSSSTLPPSYPARCQ